MSEHYAEQRFLEPRQTLTGSATSLDNLIVDELPQGCFCYVVAETGLFRLDKFSVAAVAYPEVTATGKGSGSPGRWNRYHDPTGLGVLSVDEPSDIEPIWPIVQGQLVSAGNPPKLWRYYPQYGAGLPTDLVNVIKPNAVLVGNVGRWYPEEGMSVAETFAEARLLLVRYNADRGTTVVNILGRTTFHDGFQGIFDLRPRGVYADDNVDVLTSGAWALVRRESLITSVTTDGVADAKTNQFNWPPGVSTNGDTVTVWNGGQSTASIALNADGSTAIRTENTLGSRLAISSRYTCTLGFRVVMYEQANHANCGSIDCTVDLYITTDGAGVATVVVQTVPFPDTSRLLAALAGATMTVVAVAGGFEIQASRPAGLACDARTKWWVVSFEDIT